MSASEAIAVMQRFELKYLLSARQADFLRGRLEGHMLADAYGETDIASLYYDTTDYRLIRASVEKPRFKEKLRLRAYGLATDRSPVFLELKRKYEGVVYKRRVQTTVPEAERFLAGAGPLGDGGQIQREIACFRDRYGPLRPSCLIRYARTAYYEPGSDLRLTLDRNPRWRDRELTLERNLSGRSLLPPGGEILEIKAQGAMPLWLAETLSEGEIYKGSFSKYGEAYRQIMRERPPELPAPVPVRSPAPRPRPAAPGLLRLPGWA